MRFAFSSSNLAAMLLASSAMIFGAATVMAGGLKTSDTKVKATATAAKPDPSGKQMVTIELEVEKGWYIYANPVGNELLAPTATTVKVAGNNAPNIKVKYPEPVVKKDDVVGDYKIYKGKVQIPVQLQSPAAGPVEFLVTVNACSEAQGICLKQGTLKVTAK